MNSVSTKKRPRAASAFSKGLKRSKLSVNKISLSFSKNMIKTKEIVKSSNTCQLLAPTKMKRWAHSSRISSWDAFKNQIDQIDHLMLQANHGDRKSRNKTKRNSKILPCKTRTSGSVTWSKTLRTSTTIWASRSGRSTYWNTSAGKSRTSSPPSSRVRYLTLSMLLRRTNHWCICTTWLTKWTKWPIWRTLTGNPTRSCSPNRNSPTTRPNVKTNKWIAPNLFTAKQWATLW